MPQVLHTAFAEGGDYIDNVRRQGVAVEAGVTFDASGGFSGRQAGLYSYVSPAGRGKVWVVQVDGYDPPDIAWCAVTVLDGPPSADVVREIAGGRQVAVGDVLAGAD